MAEAEQWLDEAAGDSISGLFGTTAILLSAIDHLLAVVRREQAR